MAVPYVVAKAYESYGLQGTLLCLGGFFLNSVPIGAALRPPTSAQNANNSESRQRLLESGNQDEESEQLQQESTNETHKRMLVFDFIKKAFHFEALKNEPFFTIFFLPCQIILDIVYIGWLLFMVSYAINVGQTETSAVFLPIAGAAGGLVSRITLAVLIYYKPSRSPEMYAVCTAISGVSPPLLRPTFVLQPNDYHFFLCWFRNIRRGIHVLCSHLSNSLREELFRDYCDCILHFWDWGRIRRIAGRYLARAISYSGFKYIFKRRLTLSHSHTIATTSRRPVTADNHQQQSATNFQPKFSPQSVADCLPTDRRLFADRSPSGRQPIANYSPTDYRTYFTFWNLISNHLESNRRLVADCLA